MRLCSDEKGLALTNCLVGPASSYPCNYCTVTAASLKKLETAPLRQLTEDAMVRKLEDEAERLQSGLRQPFDVGDQHYTRLQQFSCGTLGTPQKATCRAKPGGRKCPGAGACASCATSPEWVASELDNCMGHLGTRKFKASVCT